MDQDKRLWALVELFGHQRIAGEVTEAELGGGNLIRVEVPAVGEKAPLTKYYNVKAIYGITPVGKPPAGAWQQASTPPPSTNTASSAR